MRDLSVDELACVCHALRERSNVLNRVLRHEAGGYRNEVKNNHARCLALLEEFRGVLSDKFNVSDLP